MALIRWEPARELQSIQQEVNRLFGTLFDTPIAAGAGAASRSWIPAMDLVEKNDEYVLRADLPGLTEKDVRVELEDNVLSVSGTRKSEHENRKDGYYRVERASGSFSRSLTLPEGVDPESIRAQFENGVLEVRIPKPEERKRRRVEIGVGGKSPTIPQSEPTSARRPKLTDCRAGCPPPPREGPPPRRAPGAAQFG